MQSPTTNPSFQGALQPAFVVCLPLNVIISPKVYEKYSSGASKGYGITQIVIGSLCILFNILSLVYTYRYGYGFIGHGFWTGVPSIVTGSLGLVAAKRKTRSWIVAYMVMCIITASLSCALLAIGIYGAAVPGYKPTTSLDSSCNKHCNFFGFISVDRIMEALLAASALIVGIISILGATICCKATSTAETCIGLPLTNFQTGGQMIYNDRMQGVPASTVRYAHGMVMPPAYRPSEI